MTERSKSLLTSRHILRFQNASDPQVSPSANEVAWLKTWIDAEDNQYRSTIMVTDLASGQSRKLTHGQASESEPRWSPDGQYIAFLKSDEAPPFESQVAVIGRGPQIHVVSAQGGSSRPLTTLLGGASQIVWSPQGDAIAFTTWVDPDEGLTNVDDPQPDLTDPYVRYNQDVMRVKRMRWKMDGVGYLGNYFTHIARVMFNPDAQDLPSPVLLTQGPTDFSGPTFSPDGQHLVVAGNTKPGWENSRKQYIYRIDATREDPGPVEELFGLEEMRSTDLAYSPDGNMLAFCGHNDPALGHYGNQRVWVYSFGEQSARCLTDDIDTTFGDYSRDGDMTVRRGSAGDDGPIWLSDNKGLLVISNQRGTTHLNRLCVRSGELTPLLVGERVLNGFSVAPDDDFAVGLVADAENPGDLYQFPLREGAEQELKRLTHINDEVLNQVALNPAQPFTFESDGEEILGWVVSPPDRKPGERYPILLYNGGGAGGMRTGLLNYQAQFFAANGYVVLHCNARGNHGHGEAFSAVGRGRWGSEDYQDNMRALAAAAEQFDFVDLENKGVYGGSYGGYMTTWTIGHQPDFKAAVAVNLLYDRFSFNGTGDMSFLLDQVEFDRKPPWEWAEKYWERSPMKYVAGIKTPTLVIHAGEDHRCPVDQGEQLFNHLQALQVPSELVRFAQAAHGIREPWHRVLRSDVMLDWFNRHMGC